MGNAVAKDLFNPHKYFTKPLSAVDGASSYFSVEDATSAWTEIPEKKLRGLVDEINGGAAWRKAVYDFSQKSQNPWLEKIVLSPVRSLFLDVLDLDNVSAALDVGSGWGQLTRALAERVDFVMSVEPNPSKLAVNYAICQQEALDNICFLQTDAFSLPINPESFDLILLCGVYEWLAIEQEGDVKTLQEQVLRTLSRLLRPGGKLIIAIENRVGLKYLFGERDDHSMQRHVSCLPYDEASALFKAQDGKNFQARTYDMDEYRQSLLANGFADVKFNLAFPDYKLPQLIVPAENSDALQYIVKHSHLPNEHDGADGSVSTNNEILARAYSAINNLDLIKYLAPSFIIEAEKRK